MSILLKVFKIENVLVCRIVERLNRFVVLVYKDGKYYRAHINNTGRLHEFLVKDRKAFCLRHLRPYKTDFRLFAVEEHHRGALIDTQLQMKVFESALEKGIIPWLEDCRLLKRNARMASSLIDYLLEFQGENVFLEVKSSVLRENSYAMYPDCPSLRGQKHIKELTDHVRKGGKAFLLFMAALPHVTAFKPNRAADPKLFELLKKAQKAGVKIKSIGIFFNPKDSLIYLFNPDLKISL